MLKLKSNALIGSLLIAVFMLFSANLLIAQDMKTVPQEENSNNLSDRLTTQLNLNDEQSQEINTIISDYHLYRTNEAQGMDVSDARFQTKDDVNAAITATLDDTQLATWESMKAEWWNEFDRSFEGDGIQEREAEVDEF
jgi:hypothetical protein